jgi:hypothetical protein
MNPNHFPIRMILLAIMALGSASRVVRITRSGELQYRYDGSGAFLGPLVITANVELTGANSFIYRSTIQIVDDNGDLIATLCGRATGTRFE